MVSVKPLDAGMSGTGEYLQEVTGLDEDSVEMLEEWRRERSDREGDERGGGTVQVVRDAGVEIESGEEMGGNSGSPINGDLEALFRLPLIDGLLYLVELELYLPKFNKP